MSLVKTLVYLIFLKIFSDEVFTDLKLQNLPVFLLEK